MHQLERVVCPPEKGSEDKRPISEQQLRNVIARKMSKMLDQFQEELRSSYRSAPTAGRSNYCPSCAVELVVNCQEFLYEYPECHMVINADDIQDVSSVRPPKNPTLVYTGFI